MKRRPAPGGTSVWLHGARGRMGRAVSAQAADTHDVVIRGEIDLRVGGNSEVPDNARAGETVIDFSRPDAVEGLLEALDGSGLKLVSGTTGLSERALEVLREYSKETAVLYDQNMSYGISALRALLRVAGPLLRSGHDVEVVEYHRRGKYDFPSGTALSLAKTLDPSARVVSGREDAGGTSQAIHIHSVRLGEVPGEHHVHFAGDEEVITLSHRALSRTAFARGAIRAVRFLSTRDRGLFCMDDLVNDATV